MREMVLPFMGGVVACIVILLGDILYKAVDLILNRGLSAKLVTLYLLYKVPAVAVLGFGIATLMATSLVVNRLAKDGELVAFRVSGVSIHRVVLPILTFAVTISVAAYLINESIAPNMNHKSENIIRRLLFSRPEPLIENDKYFRASGDYYFYVREVDRVTNTLRDVMVYQRDTEGRGYPRVIVAKRARQVHGVWTLFDCREFKFNRNGVLKEAGRTEEIMLNLKDNIEGFWGDQRTPFEMPIKELGKQIEVFKRGGIDVRRMEVEYHRKLAIPLAAVVLSLVSIPLSMRWARAGSFVGLLLTVVLFFLYNGAMSWSCALGVGARLPAAVAAWLPNAIFTCLGLLLLFRER